MINDGHLTEILKTILNGDVTKEEMERRLQQTIDDALSGPLDAPADMALVKDCQSLLWHLKTNGSLPYPDHMAENKQKLMEKLHRPSFRKSHPLFFRAAVAAASLLILLAFSLISIQWIDGKSSPDGQQYIVQGHEITTELIQKSIAENLGQGDCITTSREEAEAFLGFEIPLPDTLLGQYTCEKYYIQVLPIWIQCITEYSFEGKKIGITTFYLTDIENSTLFAEQDENGEYLTLNNTKVYFSYNVEKSIISWTEENIVFHISGSFDSEQGIKITNEIMRE